MAAPYYIAGAVVAALVVGAIVWWVVSRGSAPSLWRCPHCNGTFLPFEGGSALCHHCHSPVTPPPGMARQAALELVPPVAAAPAAPQPARTCPECAETVLAGARRCRHCGHDFTDDN